MYLSTSRWNQPSKSTDRSSKCLNQSAILKTGPKFLNKDTSDSFFTPFPPSNIQQTKNGTSRPKNFKRQFSSSKQKLKKQIESINKCSKEPSGRKEPKRLGQATNVLGISQLNITTLNVFHGETKGSWHQFSFTIFFKIRRSWKFEWLCKKFLKAPKKNYLEKEKLRRLVELASFRLNGGELNDQKTQKSDTEIFSIIKNEELCHFKTIQAENILAVKSLECPSCETSHQIRNYDYKGKMIDGMINRESRMSEMVLEAYYRDFEADEIEENSKGVQQGEDFFIETKE